MRNNRLFLIVVLLVMGWLVAVTSFPKPALAQDNLLTNPSFEGAYSSYVPNPPISDCSLGVCTTAQMAAGWWPWWVSQTGSDQPWQNRMPEYKPAEAPFLDRVHGGSRAQQYFTFHSTHTAGLWQRLNVPANSRLQFTVWGMAWSSTDDDASYSNYPTPVNMRIGIDPTGGTNPFSPAIVWSGTANQYDSYALFSVEAQAQGDAVTVFMYSAPVEARKHNDIYWDDASLTVVGAGIPSVPAGGTGGTTTNPTQLGPTPTPNADGVILVMVQPGDTLWSVAARAGLTLDQILELNDLTRDSFIQPGQQLIIGYGDASSAAAPTGEGGGGVEGGTGITTTVTTTDTVSVEPTATPEPEPTPIPTQEPVATSEPEETAGSICLTAFDDANKNGLQDAGEVLRGGVAFTVTNADTQTVTSNYITDTTTNSYCIEGLEPGNYLVTRSVQTNEQMTTPDNWGVAIVAGAATTLAFGSFIDETPPTAIAEVQPENAAAADETAATGEGALTNAETPEEESRGSGLVTGIVIAVVVLAVLLLVGVLAVILSARRHTV